MTQTEANQRNSARRLASVISANFVKAQILTFPCGPATNMTRKYADAQYTTLINRARRMMGGPFPYVWFVEHMGEMGFSFRLIVDLPSDICQEIAAMWFMGKATVEEQTPDTLRALAKRMVYNPWKTMEPYRRAWNTSRNLVRVPPS